MPPSRIPFALADARDEIERLCGSDTGVVKLYLQRPAFDKVASELKDRFGVPARGFGPEGHHDYVQIGPRFLVCCKVDDG